MCIRDRTYTAKQDEYLATLPIGYADGIIRKNQGRKVYINGKYFEIVGRVCTVSYTHLMLIKILFG